MPDNLVKKRKIESKNFPKNPIYRVNYFLYILIILLSILFTIAPIVLLIIASMIMESQFIIYVWSAVIALIIGALAGITLMHVAGTKMKFKVGIFLASIFSSALIFIISVFININSDKYRILGINILFEALIILVMFNIVPLLLLYFTKHNLD